MKAILIFGLLSFNLALAKEKPVVSKAKPAATVEAPAGATLKAQPAKGNVKFEAVGKPSFLKIKGEGEGPEGQVRIADDVKGTFKFKLASLSTGISLRDQHMKEKYLKVEQFPTAELTLNSLKFDPNAGGTQSLPFEGQLTVHGVPKPVKGTVDVSKNGEGYKVKASFETKISDHGIEIPSYANITVADSVKVLVETEML